MGLPQLAPEASPSRHDRRCSDRAGRNALDPTHSDPRAARYGRLRRCRRRGRDLPTGVATSLCRAGDGRGPARIGAEWRCLAGRAPDRVRSPARRPTLEADLRMVTGEQDLRLQLRAGLAGLEHCPAARDPRDRRIRASGDCVPDGQPAQPVRPWRRAVRLRAPHRTGAACASLLGGHGRLRSGLRLQRVRGLAERGDLRGHHERDDGVRRRDGGAADPDRAVAALARREPGRAASSAAGRRRLPDRGRAGRRRCAASARLASSPASHSSTDPPAWPCASSSR